MERRLSLRALKDRVSRRRSVSSARVHETNNEENNNSSFHSRFSRSRLSRRLRRTISRAEEATTTFRRFRSSLSVAEVATVASGEEEDVLEVKVRSRARVRN